MSWIDRAQRGVAAGLLLLLCTVPAAFADAQLRRPLTADDLDLLQTLSDPQVSPDGRWVAYVVTTNDREADEQRSAIWMVSWDGTQRLRLTNPASGTSKPRWSPDGRSLAYVASVAGSDKNRLMLLDPRGGEARALLSDPGILGEYAWSPDGKRLVLVMEQGEGTTKPPKPIVIDYLYFKEDESGYFGAGHARHLYLVDVQSGRLDELTADAQFNEDLPVWSPDGARIAFIRTHEKGPDADGQEDIDVIDSRTGAPARTVVRHYAPNFQKLAWSPDGALIAYLQGLEPKYNSYMQDRLAVVPAAGGAPRPLTDKLDRAVSSYAFSSDSRSFIIAVQDDRTVYPARLSLAGGAITREGAPGPFVISALSSAAGHTALLESNDHAPDEVYALEAGRLRKLTAHNDALFAQLQLGAVEDIAFRSKDGTEIHGFIVKPPSFVPGRRYPTVLWMHGGPNDQDEHSLTLFGYRLGRLMLASKGFVILRINYRGSCGRGAAFAQEILADWGHKEVEDLLAGVDYLIARGVADPDRLGIGGWSYGAILTDYTIASDGRFKAAISGAGTGSEVSMYGTDEYILQDNNEFGAPWQSPELWIKLSYPFLHADRIHTPTLFLGGDADFNVPIAGSEQMYQALRTLGVPTQLVVYPGEHHILTRPSFVKDLTVRIPAWYERFLGPP